MLKSLLIISLLTTLTADLLTILYAQNVYGAGNSYNILEKILIKKPYIKQYDPIVIEEIVDVDQFNQSCPLPFKSSSTITGCACDFRQKNVNCFYANKLGSLPAFVKPLSNKDKSIWSIDLRCKNFSVFDNFNSLDNLNKVDVLDMSGSFQTNKYCYIYDDSKKKNYTLESQNAKLLLLTNVGTNESSIGLEKINLTINSLILKSNLIEHLNLTKRGFGLDQNSQVRIYTVDLENNLIRNIDVFWGIEICFFEIKSLLLSKNNLEQLDVWFLILVRYLNVKYNKISTFSIDMLEKYKFIDDRFECVTTNYINETFLIFNSVLTRLDFSHNRLISLPFSFLKIIKFSLVESLNFTHNRINVLRNHEFNNMEKLEDIFLAKNKIEKIESLALQGLQNLKRLDLSENLLSSLPDDLFNQANLTIQLISLSQNKFDHIPRKALRYCNSTKYLYLNQNKIEKLENFSFGFMYNLLELYLSGNLIEIIEQDAFQIDDDSIIGPGLIEKLDISNNRLSFLNNSIFSYLTNLRYLLLNNNFLKIIEDDTFLGVNYLITLDLNINLLQELNFLHRKNRFSKLRYLKLSNNRLETIDSTLFAHLNALKLLDLSSNKIRNITDCAFYGLENSIDKLILNYNLIEVINPCAFSLDFKNLRFVQVLHNPINCTNTCGFFFTIYNPPYSIKYEGYECSDGTIKNYTFCTQDDYQKIYSVCRNKMRGSNSCLKISANKISMKRNALIQQSNINSIGNIKRTFFIFYKLDLFFFIELIFLYFPFI